MYYRASNLTDGLAVFASLKMYLRTSISDEQCLLTISLVESRDKVWKAVRFDFDQLSDRKTLRSEMKQIRGCYGLDEPESHLWTKQPLGVRLFSAPASEIIYD
jgi:hypothetical protein